MQPDPNFKTRLEHMLEGFLNPNANGFAYFLKESLIDGWRELKHMRPEDYQEQLFMLAGTLQIVMKIREPLGVIVHNPASGSISITPLESIPGVQLIKDCLAYIENAERGDSWSRNVSRRLLGEVSAALIREAGTIEGPASPNPAKP